jgi:hypothetical protein
VHQGKGDQRDPSDGEARPSAKRRKADGPGPAKADPTHSRHTDAPTLKAGLSASPMHQLAWEKNIKGESAGVQLNRLEKESLTHLWGM